MRVLLWLVQPKIGIPLAILVLCVVGPFAYRGMRLSQIPAPPEPFDIAAFKADIVPEEMNGAKLLIAASKRLRPVPRSEFENGNYDAFLNGGWNAASPKLQQWVLDNRDVLDMWRQLALMPDVQVFKPGEADYFTLLSHSQEARRITHLLIGEATRCRFVDQPAAAGELLVDGLRVADHLARHGWLMEYLIRDSIYQDIGDAMLDWAIDPAVSPEDLRKLVDQGMPTLTQRMTVERHLKFDYLMLRHFTDDWSWSDRYDLISSGRLRKTTSFDNALFRLQYFQGEPENAAKVAGHLYGRNVEEVSRPRHERSKLFRRGRVLVFEPTRGRARSTLTASQIADLCGLSPLSAYVMSWNDGALIYNDQSLARIELLRVAMALEQYRRRSGRYPDRLEELVPQFISQIPDDDFSDVKTPLKYARDGESAKVWSVGPNGVDDGGDVTRPRVLQLSASLETPDFGLQLGAARETLKQQRGNHKP